MQGHVMERCLANPIALRQAILYAAAVARLVDEYVALGAVHELVPLRCREQVARGVMHFSEGRKADLACVRSAVSPADMPPAAERGGSQESFASKHANRRRPQHTQTLDRVRLTL